MLIHASGFRKRRMWRLIDGRSRGDGGSGSALAPLRRRSVTTALNEQQPKRPRSDEKARARREWKGAAHGQLWTGPTISDPQWRHPSTDGGRPTGKPSIGVRRHESPDR